MLNCPQATSLPHRPCSHCTFLPQLLFAWSLIFVPLAAFPAVQLPSSPGAPASMTHSCPASPQFSLLQPCPFPALQPERCFTEPCSSPSPPALPDDPWLWGSGSPCTPSQLPQEGQLLLGHLSRLFCPCPTFLLWGAHTPVCGAGILQDAAVPGLSRDGRWEMSLSQAVVPSPARLAVQGLPVRLDTPL